MNLSTLAQLELQLEHSESFSDTFAFYLQHFADQKTFLDFSDITDVPIVTTLLGELSKAFFRKPKVMFAGLRMLKVNMLKILHGAAFIEGYHVAFFYCKNINKGMAAFYSASSPKVHYFRMTPQPCGNESLPDNLYDDVFAGRTN